MTFYDSIAYYIARSIALVAPGAASQYWRNQLVCRNYEAAANRRANRNYRPAQKSGAQEISSAWQAVTNKIRDLDRNNSHVAGMRRRFTAALVGEGSWPRPKVLKRNAASRFDFDVNINNQLLDRWELWSKNACANGDSVYQLQRIASNAFFLDGGLLIHRVIKNGALKLEAIELDQLDRAYNLDNGNGERIVDGIKLDEYNEPISYFIKKRFPSEIESKTVEIPARDIIHLYDRERASAVSGISRLASAALNFKNIGDYRADTMALARVGTGFGVFVETANPEDYFSADSNGAQGEDFAFVEPGAVHYLRPGEKISQVTPQNPGTQYSPFLKAELQSASVGAGMSYESVSNDGSNSNFSGARQMLLFERAMLRYTFSIFEEVFYSRLYEWFVEFETSFKGLRLQNYDREKARYLRCTWSRPKTEWVDPLKDANAAKTEIEMGANTITDFCETAGRDIEEVIATRKYEKELLAKAGLIQEFTESEGLNNAE